MANFDCRDWRACRFAEISSRTAAWGQPPVSMARIRDGGRAAWWVRNSASSLIGKGGVSSNYLVSGKKEGALRMEMKALSEDIIRQSCNAVFIPKRQTELEHQSRLARSHWSAKLIS